MNLTNKKLSLRNHLLFRQTPVLLYVIATSLLLILPGISRTKLVGRKSFCNIFQPEVDEWCENSQASHLHHEEGSHHHCRHELLANMWIARHHWSRNQNLTKSSHSREIFRRVRLPQIIFAEKWTAVEDPSSRQTLFYSYQRREFWKFSGSEIFLILIK